MSPYDDFLAGCQQLVGLKCWSIIGVPRETRRLALDFGAALPKDRPTKNTNLTELQRTHHGEFRLFLECTWRISSSERIVMSSASSADTPDDAAPGVRTRPPGSETIIDTPVLSVEVARGPGYDLLVTFSNGSVLDVFPDQYEQDDNCSLTTPTHFYSVGKAGMLLVKTNR